VEVIVIGGKRGGGHILLESLWDESFLCVCVCGLVGAFKEDEMV
jgi:hypothetical protein